MSKNYLLIDGNSFGYYYNNAKKLTIGNLPVQAIFGFLRGLRQQLAFFQQYTPVVLWDGASWRKTMFAEYKANRDKADTKAALAQLRMKDEYQQQVPHIKKALRFLGMPQLSAFNMEADDLGAILTDRYSKDGRVILLTGDKDWLQLVGPNVTWRDFINNRMVTLKNFEEMTGVETPAQFVEVKALMGDTGDNVPGVGGIGEKGAVEFIKTYGSFANFTNQVIFEKSIDLKSLPKKYRDLVENEEKAIAFARNITLMDLRTKHRPAPINLNLDKGEPDALKFKRFCEILLFNSILKEFDDWIRVFPAFREEAALAA